MKRIFELCVNDMDDFNKRSFIDGIRHSEGRTILAETVVLGSPLAETVSNPELAAASGADLITLNRFSCQEPFIFGIDDEGFQSLSQLMEGIPQKIKANRQDPDYIAKIRRCLNRPVGLNLEPVPKGSDYPAGFVLNEENLDYVKQQDFDYLTITANPNTSINEENILQGIRLAKAKLEDVLIIAGKMHAAGTQQLVTSDFPENLIQAGADVILLPAPGTVPGFHEDLVTSLIARIHKAGALAMTTIGTSQEGAPPSVIETIGLAAKRAGADIQHIGDAGLCGMALPENIFRLSTTIRGLRHTYRRIGYSPNRPR